MFVAASLRWFRCFAISEAHREWHIAANKNIRRGSNMAGLKQARDGASGFFVARRKAKFRGR
jgi:hypothetical protein